MSAPIPFPGDIGGTIVLPAGKAGKVTIVAGPPSDAPPFQVGDICTFGPFRYQFRVTRVDGDNVTFKRIS